MRTKLLGTLALAALLWLGMGIPAASAHWRSGGYYGNGFHDYVPHWHSYATPFGSYSYYGNGFHDYVPHGHYYGMPYSGYSYPSYGGYYGLYNYGYNTPYSYGGYGW